MLKVLSLLLLSTVGTSTDGRNYYEISIQSVYDGDTIRADINLGFNIWLRNESIRFHKINAPELKGATSKRGTLSRDHLASLLKDHEVMIVTAKDEREKYGRVLATVLVRGKKDDWCNEDTWCDVNDQMIQDGFAVLYRGD